MCRRNLLYGAVAVAFGVGLLLGLLIPSGFLRTLLGLGLLALGVFLIVK